MKKPLLILPIIFLLMLLLFVGVASAFTVKMLENTPSCLACHQIYEVCNDNLISNMAISKDNFAVSFYDTKLAKYDFNSYKGFVFGEKFFIEKLAETEKVEWVDSGKETCTEMSNISVSHFISCTPDYVEKTMRANVSFWEQIKPKSLNLLLKSNECIKIKIIGNLKVGQATDVVLKLDSVEYKQFAWWNGEELNLTKGLIYYFNLDNKNLTNSVAGGGNLVTDNSGIDTIAGKHPTGTTAPNFNANSEGMLTAAVDLGPTVSVCLWAYRTAIANGYLTRYAPSADQDYFDIIAPAYTNVIMENNNVKINISGITTGAWYHLCMVKNRTDIWAYVNGALNGTVSGAAQTTGTDTDTIKVGEALANNPAVAIDEFALWNGTMLNLSQVQFLYNNSAGSYFPFNNPFVPPSAPVILTPTASAYEENINISWNASVPYNATTTAISYYNVSLMNENNSTNLTIANAGLNLSKIWNSSVVKNKDWRINVTAYDNNTLQSSSISPTFSTHNYQITISINPSLYYGQNATCNFTIYDTDTTATLTAYVDFYKNGTVIDSIIQSVSNNVTDGKTYSGSLFAIGDQVYCSIKPYDNVLYGFIRNSSAVTFAAAPNLTFTNCTSNNSTFNINILEENTLKPMTAKIDALIQYRITQNVSVFNNFSTTYSENSSYSICVNQTVYANIYLIYAGNFTQRWYIYNTTLNATPTTPQNFTIYNWANSSGVSTLKITVRDNSSYSLSPNIIGRLQRYYAGEGVWRTVQMDKSAENGETLYNIREIDTDYKLQYYDTNNHLLRQTESSKWFCTAGLCEATALVPDYSALAAASTETSWSYNNNTKIITTQWNDINIQTVNSVVSKETASGTQILCNETQASTSGSIQCNITSYQGEIKLQTFINGQEIPIITEWIDTKASTLRDLIGESESTFWTVAIVITTAMAGLISPAAVIIFTMFGLVLTYLLGLFAPLTIPMLTIACVLGLIIAIKVKY
jgi:hypothetical protein